MKKLLILSMVIVVAGGAFAQSPKKKASFTTTVQGRQKPTPTPPPIRKEPVQGAIPRAIRGGNPLQMLNPKAPAKYGTAADHVILDPDTGKWKGIKLFEFVF